MRFVSKLIVAIAALAFAGAASATTMTVTCSTLNGPTEISGNVVCPQFSGLGLLSVAITVDGTIGGSITLTNNATATETGEGMTTSSFMVGPLTGFSIANPLFSATFNTGLQSLTPGQTRTFSGLSGTGSATITDTSAFAPYSGAGNFDIPLLTATMLMITGGGGNFAGGQSTTGTATATVTYTFGSTVPEVGTPIYLATGLGAILLGLWRRRSR
jgi:hypothetical protein